MRRFLALALCPTAFTGCERAADADLRGPTLRVLRTLPHDPGAYTQGLLVRDGVFFESTGQYGESSVREVAIESGEVLRRRELSQRYFGEGLASIGDRLYQLTWRQQTGFVYDTRLEPVDTFSYGGEGWGLTTDGAHLILSDGSYLLRFLDPATFRLVRSVEVRDGSQVVFALNELEWVEGEIWANVWQQDNIARIDPQTGTVVGWVNVGGYLSWWDRFRGAEVANGIAYDPETKRLWVTGKYWPHVFEVAVPGRAP